MQYVTWIGAAISLIGLAGIIWSIILITRAKRAQLSEEQMRARLQSIMPINIGALMLSILGLGVVTVGLFLS